ncbi:MAG: bifunctional diaminohydroxyphosphoribosylaminopyrimidine deaminase/5-amino-6-(5-phosphoribosylamino)uracil reductase RibD [Gemmatimonadaceae bacterium]
MKDPSDPATARDSAFMRRALTLARKGWGQTAPNPMVGAVVVRADEIAGEGFHALYGGEHAETVALRTAGARARGSTVYVTLEPCAHIGHTPPCADALIAAGVRRVVAATADPTPAAAGGGARLADAGIDFEAGVEGEAARELNAAFFHAAAHDTPFLTLKLAMSLDGAIADATRTPGWLTGERARREVHRLRGGSDAVAVGIGTALADNPLLTVRGVRAPRVPPRRVVFDRTARLPLESNLVKSAREVPVIVVAEHPDSARGAALRAAGVNLLVVASLDDGLRALRRLGVQSLLVEGGAALAGALIARSHVHRLIIFQSPVVLGEGSLPAFGSAPTAAAAGARRLRVIARRAFGDDLMTTYAPG